MNRLEGILPRGDYRLRRGTASKVLGSAMAHRRFLPRERLPGMVLFIASLLVLGYILGSDAFYVYYPEVVGNQVTAEEKIIAESGIQGYHIFFIDPRQMVGAVAQLPDISRVSVRFSLPNNLQIDVEERKAHIAWQVGESTYHLDAQGHVLSLQSAEVAITIRDLSGEVRQPGDQIPAQILRAAEAYQALDTTLAQFEYSPEYGLSILTRAGTRVILGDQEQAEEKLTIWHALSGQLEGEGKVAQIIDLRFTVPYFHPLAE